MWRLTGNDQAIFAATRAYLTLRCKVQIVATTDARLNACSWRKEPSHTGFGGER
jgi:hypothetical protein